MQLLGADVGAVGGEDGDEDRQRDVALAAAGEEVDQVADDEADGDPAERDADELERGAAEAEGAAGGDADGDPVEDERGARR